MEWIKIKDKKPKLFKRVLIYPNEESVVISKLTELDGVLRWQDEGSIETFGFETVDNWMELPEEPNCG